MSNFKATLLIGLHILHWTSGEYNIAFNKVVSTSNNVTGHLAAMIIDQDLNTYVQVDPGNKLGTWLLFDLQGIYDIKKMIIWPTNDDDFIFARVYVYIRMTRSTSSNPGNVSHTYDYPEKGVAHTFIPVIQGRYALLRKDASFANEILKIAEVAILTENTEFSVMITGPVSQNYFTYDFSTPAERAIDKDVYTCVVSSYDREESIQSWWRADLGDVYQLYAVNINDYRTSAIYRGFYSVYLDPSSYTMQQLCMFFNRSTVMYDSYFQLLCNTVVTGRYLTVIRTVKSPVAFCEIQVIAVNEEIFYAMPKDYNDNTGKISTAITTKTLLPSSPTILFATSYTTIVGSIATPSTTEVLSSFTTKSISPSTTQLSSSNADDSSRYQQKCQLEIKQATSNLETQKIVIGVVVGVLAVILGIILGFVGGSIYQKKKSAKQTESTLNQNTNTILSKSAADRITNLRLTESSVNENIKNENEEHSIYNDINYTPMKQVHAYDTVVV